MSRTKKQPINPYIKELLEKNGFLTVKQAADALQINYNTLNRLSAGPGRHTILEFHREAAKKFGVPFEQWVDAVIGGERHAS